MAGPMALRVARVAARALPALAGLAVLVGAVRWALLGLVPYEERLDPFWFAIYTHVGWGLVGTLAAIAVLAALHLLRFGREDIRPRGPGDVLPWWSLLERLAHWAFVASFAVLLVTGLQLYLAGFGLPDALTRVMRRWHLGEPFWVTGAVVFAMWAHDAWPRRYDARWLAQGGGYLWARGRPGERAPLPAGRFNAGQKLWFWLETLGAVVMAVTGYEMRHHFTRFDDGYLTLLAAHLGAAWAFLAVVGVHFYLAVVGVRGALGGMIHGRVGRSGAQRLHPDADALKRADAR